MKLRISERDKNSIFALLSILVILFVFVIMFFPELVDYEYSISKLSNKKDSVDSTMVQLNSNENFINKLESDIVTKMDEVALTEEEVEKLGSVVSVDKFDLHIPSLFITLEEAAKLRNLEFTIMYDRFKMDDSSVMEEAMEGINGLNELIDGGLPSGEAEEGEDAAADVPEMAPEETTEEATVPEEGLGGIESTPEDDKDIVEGEEGEIVEEPVESIIEEDYGIKFASIPITIRGEFLSVRDFIRSLDELDFVEAARIDISSSGETVIAGIMLRIYYGEGDIN